jgi:ABC-type multidrug transport system ATPase subunit
LLWCACRHVKIGNPLEKGISGGQAKRVNIGISLITSPRVLFLDEPTSGLDSFTANEVMTTVKSLVTDGEGLLASCHAVCDDRCSLPLLHNKCST